MRKVFADTGYWIAVLNPADGLHEKAKEVSASLGTCIIVTSEMVLAELLNYFAERGDRLRAAAVSLSRNILKNPNCSVIPQTAALFADALGLYEERPDKGWSLTDCASILIMQRESMTEALAHDSHFTQAGFTALLQ